MGKKKVKEVVQKDWRDIPSIKHDYEALKTFAAQMGYRLYDFTTTDCDKRDVVVIGLDGTHDAERNPFEWVYDLQSGRRYD